MDEISIGGLFHKRQNFLFCASHLILSNMPKAIHPHAHCLKNAPFIRISPRFKQRGKRLDARLRISLCLHWNQEKEGKWDLNRRTQSGLHTPKRMASEHVCLFVPCCNQCAKLQKAFVCCIYLRTGAIDTEQTQRLSPIWTLPTCISDTISVLTGEAALYFVHVSFSMYYWGFISWNKCIWAAFESILQRDRTRS